MGLCCMWIHAYESTFLQGLDRYSKADINHLLDEELAAQSQMLGDKSFLLGHKPCHTDATRLWLLSHVRLHDTLPSF